MSTGKKKWVRFRHRVVWVLFYPFFALAARIKYGANIRRFKRPANDPCVVLFNHVTAYDQFFVAISFKRPIYFVASEDLFSNGLISKLLSFAVAPIPINKHTTDIKALYKIFSVAKEGGTIALSPEGNRTYSGRTVFMKESIVSLCRKLKRDIVLYRIEGGYGVQPRWSDAVRKGHMECGVSKIITPEEYGKMSDEELYDTIVKGLYVDAANSDNVYTHKNPAEYLERAMYVCPDCGLSTFESTGDKIKCLKCGKTIRYNKDTSLTGEGFEFPYKYVADWYDCQNDYVNTLDLTAMTGEPVYTETADVYKVTLYKKKELIGKNAKICLYGDRAEFSFDSGETRTVKFSDVVGIACMGRNKLNIDQKSGLYQIKGSKRFNAVKYVNFCYRYKNLTKGDKDDKFLGI